MNSIFLFVGVTIALASAFIPTFPLLGTDVIVAKLCQNIAAKSNSVNGYYSQIFAAVNANQNAAQSFPETLDYLSDENAGDKLTAGGQSCIKFFADLKVHLQNDYVKSGITPQAAALKVAQFITKLIATVLPNQG